MFLELALSLSLEFKNLNRFLPWKASKRRKIITLEARMPQDLEILELRRSLGSFKFLTARKKCFGYFQIHHFDIS